MRSSHVESAKHAFECLRPGKRLDTLLIKRKLLLVADIFGVDVDGRHSAEMIATTIFRTRLDLFTKQVRVTQQDDNICVFSDVYDVDTTKFDRFVRRCVANRLPTSAFEVTYPMAEFSDRFMPPHEAKIMTVGYKGFYRGKIAGIVF